MLEQEILTELQKLNANFDKSRQPLYKNFLAGFLHSLGAAGGTLILWGVTFWVLSLFSGQIIKSSTKFVEDLMANINWAKIMPQPKMLELPQGFNLNSIDLNSLQGQLESQ
jgi:hypothetical protein